jgi:hypothetical protein
LTQVSRRFGGRNSERHPSARDQHAYRVSRKARREATGKAALRQPLPEQKEPATRKAISPRTSAIASAPESQIASQSRVGSHGRALEKKGNAEQAHALAQTRHLHQMLESRRASVKET